VFVTARLPLPPSKPANGFDPGCSMIVGEAG
jgi:hypothetical protein